MYLVRERTGGHEPRRLLVPKGVAKKGPTKRRSLLLLDWLELENQASRDPEMVLRIARAGQRVGAESGGIVIRLDCSESYIAGNLVVDSAAQSVRECGIRKVAQINVVGGQVRGAEQRINERSGRRPNIKLCALVSTHAKAGVGRSIETTEIGGDSKSYSDINILYLQQN